MAPDLGDISYGVAGAVVAAFAVWLLYLSPRQRATRALSLALGSMGFLWVYDLVTGFTPLAFDLAYLRAAPIAFVLLALSTIYFLSVYPRPRGWLGHSPAAPRLLVGLGLGLAVLLLAFPGLWATPVVEDGELAHIDGGPLRLLNNAWSLTVVLLLLFLAIEHARTPEGPVRGAMTLVIAGFMGSQLAWQSTLLFNDLGRRLSVEALTPAVLRVEYLLEEALIVPVLAALVVVLVAALRSDEPSRRRQAFGLASLAVVVLGASAILAWRTPPPEPGEWSNSWQGLLDASAGVGIAVFCGYALLKHRLFDIEVKLRWTISRGTVAAVFVGVFFVVSQMAQNFLEDSMGWALGGIIAGLMLFAIAPIQRIADHVADVAMPRVRQREAAMPAAKRADFYRLALEMALSDRVITRAEERHLAALAEQLGLSHTEALALREAVERESQASVSGIRFSPPQA